jgi:type IV pilus assembly protein PilE
MNTRPAPGTASHSAGFTLVELMITLLVVAILAAIAVPSYQAQIRSGRRTDAKNAVLDLAGREERYYSASNAYTTDPTQLGYPAGAFGSLPIGGGYYTVNVINGQTGDTRSFKASASPISGTSQASDAQCQYFSVDNFGVQFSSDTGAGGTNTSATCWH